MKMCETCKKYAEVDFFIHCNCGFQLMVTSPDFGFFVDMEDIKQNGLSLDSPLLWALLPNLVNWAAITCHGNKLVISCPAIYSNKDSSSGWTIPHTQRVMHGELSDILNIKINYQGDWRDSLTKRPEGL